MRYEPDRRCRDLADRQGGALRRDQANSAGMTDRMIRTRVEAGAWVKVASGLFLLPGYADVKRRLLIAAVMALPAVVSHESAAELHDLPFVPRGRAVITVPFWTTHKFPEVIVHRSTDLRPDHLATVQGLPTTGLARTAIDLAAVLRPGRLQKLMEYCLVTRAFSWEQLETTFLELARRGKPGCQLLRKILADLGPGVTLSESILERRLLEVLVAGGLPIPVQQYPRPWPDALPGRVDFAYPSARLIIEVDGRRWHALRESFDSDRRRDNLALVSGWRVLRFTWRQLVEEPDEVCRMVRAALAGSAQAAS